MPIPTKPNPRKYTVTTKVTSEVFKGLKQEAALTTEGNMSQLIFELITSDDYIDRPYPDDIFEADLKDIKNRKKSTT
jgi:hypothetical protein